MEQTFAIPVSLPPQVCGAVQEPQLSVPPHPSSIVPQFFPTAAHVTGSHAIGAVEIAQSAVPFVGASRGDPALMAFGRAAALWQALFVAASFAALATLFMARLPEATRERDGGELEGT